MGEAGPTVKVVAGEEGCKEAVAAGGIAVMVDALRASATITALVHGGAAPILVATHVAQARRLAEKSPGALLIGEREGFPPKGFHGGNSPEEVLGLGVEGKQIVFTSTTGAGRLGQLRGAGAALVGGPLNASAVADLAVAVAGDRPVYCVAAGLTGQPGGTREDWLGAALIADKLGDRGFDWVNRDEGAGEHWPERLTATAIADGFAASPHGQSLVAKGLGRDVATCSRIDWLAAVAQVSDYLEIDDGPPVAVLRPAS